MLVCLIAILLGRDSPGRQSGDQFHKVKGNSAPLLVFYCVRYKNGQLGLICETYGLQPQDIVFFDDSEVNLLTRVLTGVLALC